MGGKCDIDILSAGVQLCTLLSIRRLDLLLVTGSCMSGACNGRQALKAIAMKGEPHELRCLKSKSRSMLCAFL